MGLDFDSDFDPDTDIRSKLSRNPKVEDIPKNDFPSPIEVGIRIFN